MRELVHILKMTSVLTAKPMRESLHHIGHVVSSIGESLDHWRASLGGVEVSEVFEDPIQKVRVVFIDLPPAGTPQYELVEPASADSPVWRFAEQGGGLHHLCFEVDNLDEHIVHMKSLKAALIRPPRPAVAFGGRRIAWMHLREKLLVEYLERAL
jgi:methylmalonyl-CoA/ethylmalonyl-CoA epimerase